MKNTILDQVKNIIIKYIESRKINNKKTIINKIKNSLSIDELINHITYWRAHPYELSPKSYVYAVIECNYDATHD